MVSLSTAIKELNTGVIEFDYPQGDGCTTEGETVIFLERLARFEEIGLEPEEIAELLLSCGVKPGKKQEDGQLQRLRPESLAKYLASEGWHQYPRKNPDIQVFQTETDAGFFQVTIPLNKNLSDYQKALTDAIQVVAESEGRTAAAVAKNCFWLQEQRGMEKPKQGQE